MSRFSSHCWSGAHVTFLLNSHFLLLQMLCFHLSSICVHPSFPFSEKHVNIFPRVRHLRWLLLVLLQIKSSCYMAWHGRTENSFKYKAKVQKWERRTEQVISNIISNTAEEEKKEIILFYPKFFILLCFSHDRMSLMFLFWILDEKCRSSDDRQFAQTINGLKDQEKVDWRAWFTSFFHGLGGDCQTAKENAEFLSNCTHPRNILVPAVLYSTLR